MKISFAIIGQNIRKARKTAHLTQEQVAENAHLSTVQYGRIERGEKQVSLTQLAQISTALHTSLASLLSGCILDVDDSAVINGIDEQPAGYAEYSLILLDQYRAQLKAYAQALKQEEEKPN